MKAYFDKEIPLQDGKSLLWLWKGELGGYYPAPSYSTQGCGGENHDRFVIWSL